MRLQMNDFYGYYPHRESYRDLVSLFKSFENLVFAFRSINAHFPQFFYLILLYFVLPSNVILILLLFLK